MTSKLRIVTMNKTSLLLPVTLACLLCATSAAHADTAAPAPAASASAAGDVDRAGAHHEAFITNQDKISYATGVQAARNLQNNKFQFNADLLMQGIKDVQDGHPLRMSEKEMKLVLQGIQNEIHRNLVMNRAEQALKNRSKGAAFTEAYKKKPGAVVLPGNIVYQVLREGNGDLPREEDTILVRYRGTTIDGTEFDATEKDSGVPLQMSQMIIGWREALKRMPVGSHWEIVIPPNLAYADRGVGSTVGPGETLIFNVELLGTRHPN